MEIIVLDDDNFLNQLMLILIIGGTGVLSSAVTKEALNKGMKVTMINRGNRSIPKGVEHIKSNKNDFETIATKIGNRQFDSVIDFLCYTDIETERSVKFYSKYTKQYFYISSCAVYNKTALNGQLAREDAPKSLPIWSYSINKWRSEQLLASLLLGSDVKYTVIRPCVTYDDTRIPYGISPLYGYHWTLCARILAGKPLIRWNGGVNKCNMLRVEDFAVGVVGLVGNPQAYNEAFNICGDETPSFNDVLSILSELLNCEVKTIDLTSEFYAEELPDRAGEILGGRSIDSINSNEKIKNAVPEFHQTIGLREGIELTFNAYQKQNYEMGIDWKFDAETDRIIHKWCRLNNIKLNHRATSFVDYLNNATFFDKIFYWLTYFNRPTLLKLLRKIRRLYQK